MSDARYLASGSRHLVPVSILHDPIGRLLGLTRHITDRAPPPGDQVAQSLARMRRYRRGLWLLALGYVPFAAAVLTLAVRSDPPMTIVVAIMLAYVAGVYVLGMAVLRMPCPRCREPFHTRKGRGGFQFYNVLTRQCVHCGLALRPDVLP